ncbi:hypothetical protein JHK86_017097 [Glycine max]|nr:hypothetical protein JHK86_017097 [Glycine max]
MLQTLELLEKLIVEECSGLKHIIDGNVYYVSSQSHTSLKLPKLKTLPIDGCERLEYIFPLCFARGLVSLEELDILCSCKLKYVFGTEKEHHLSMYQHQSHYETNIDINLLNFDDLFLSSYQNLLIFGLNIAVHVYQILKSLSCYECPSLSSSSMRKVIIDSDLQKDTIAMGLIQKQLQFVTCWIGCS